jgi:hypothetical protein
VHAFLGLANYYRCFIKGYGDIATPLTAPLHKDAFHWGPEADAMFRALQFALMTAPVLQLPVFTESFIVQCDASGMGIKVVLHQGRGPVAFFSRRLATRHASLAAYKRGLIRLVLAVCHWRSYLWGRAFIICTDHYSLKFVLDQKLITIPQHQWVSKFLGFDFSVEYKPGAANVVADVLSWRNWEAAPFVLALSAPTFELFNDLQRAFVTDQAYAHCGRMWSGAIVTPIGASRMT